LESMQVWDVRQAIAAVVSSGSPKGENAAPATPSVWLRADGHMAGVALYAALFESNVAGLDLWKLPATHADGPCLPNILRVLDLPTAVLMAAEKSVVRIHDSVPVKWDFARRSAEKMNFAPDRLIFLSPTDD
jgi:hypothetical protein